MAVLIPIAPKDSPAKPNGEYKDPNRDCEDAEASQKMADEGGVLHKKNRLPVREIRGGQSSCSGGSICLFS
ncbi:hypothetical protein GCM10011402_32790 [Paracoccus acridae]|uniref:Uncharacterized protein n=1 Tax=Paracoccus acridae TaxID=1795310 RepID=A0ABQ1VN24_9RHOB|nr:hypothetical protein GCM10011402_32790 [Paracoccus acridae]